MKNGRTHEALAAVGGEDRIPFLVDTDRGEALYESEDIAEVPSASHRTTSDDIVEHLETYYG